LNFFAQTLTTISIFLSSIGMIFIIFLVFCYLFIYWKERYKNYDQISFALNKLYHQKFLFEDHIDQLSNYSKASIEEIENVITFELKSIERDMDSNLELAPILAVVFFFMFFVSSKLKIEDFNSALFGVAGFLSLLVAFIKWLNRRNKKFKIDCFEQVLLLLQLAKSNLISEDT
jgi:hypothetical protein